MTRTDRHPFVTAEQLLTKTRKAIWYSCLVICLKKWKRMMISIPLIFIFYKKPLPRDLETKISDLGKRMTILLVSVLSVAYRQKMVENKLSKALVLVAKSACWSSNKLSKAQFWKLLWKLQNWKKLSIFLLLWIIISIL